MLEALFPDSAKLNPAAPEAERGDFAAIPGKAAVYLLAADCPEAPQPAPVLLATVGDLRAALRRRLADTPAEVKSKRVAYGAICTRVYYRVVHSAFAANFYYSQAARLLFPETAKALIPWRDSWWVAVERAEAGAMHPRFRKTNSLSDPSLAYAGPIRDKHAAARLVESLEDLFDLCRYHTILVQAPHGKACAYKEMGKCAAPCDGSVSLEAYRGQVAEALGFLTDRAEGAGARERWRVQLEEEMKKAAAALQFESAGKIKHRLSRAGLLNSEPFASTAPLEEFAFLSLQPGRGKPWIEPWLICFGDDPAIRPLPEFNVKDAQAAADHLAAECRSANAAPSPRSLSPSQTTDVALIAHHLFRGDADHGIWLRLSTVAAQGSAAILLGIDAFRAKKAPKPMAEQSSDTHTVEEVDTSPTDKT